MNQNVSQHISAERQAMNLQGGWLSVLQAMFAMRNHVVIQRQAELQLNYYSEQMRPSIRQIFEKIRDAQSLEAVLFILEHFNPPPGEKASA